MLIAEAEDLYNAMQKHVGTIYRPQSAKGGPEVFDQMWATVAPPHLERLEVTSFSAVICKCVRDCIYES